MENDSTRGEDPDGTHSVWGQYSDRDANIENVGISLAAATQGHLVGVGVKKLHVKVKIGRLVACLRADPAAAIVAGLSMEHT